MHKIFVIGGVSYNTIINLDSFPTPSPQTIFSQGFHEAIGSTGAGKALNLHKLGFNVTLHGLIGEDRFGGLIKDAFLEEGIEFICQLDPLGTKRHTNLMDPEGERISIFLNAGTFEPNLDLESIERQIAGSDFVALNVVNYCRETIPLIKKYHKETWCDIHSYDGSDSYFDDFIAAADVLVLSSEALPDYEAFMQVQIEAGKQLVICTHGKDGASALSASGRRIDTPIMPNYQQVDTNGAGDSFFSGFLYGRSRGYVLESCMRFGAICGGLCITAPELAYPALSPDLLESEFKAHFGAGPMTK